MNRFLEYLRIITSPSLWISNHPVDMGWDAWLNDAMDWNEFEIISEHRAEIRGVEVWIGNHPYASFAPIAPDGGVLGILPRRLTRVRAMNQMMRSITSQTSATA